MKKFFRKTILLAFAAVLSYGFMSCSDSGDEGNYWSETASSSGTAKYTVTFNANGGSGSMSSQTFTAGVAQALSANAFTKDGYKFLGWSENSSATTATYDDKQSITISANKALYAVWTEAGNYKYTVVHMLQTSLTSALYEEKVDDRLIDSGAAGAKTAAKANTYKNYTAKAFEQKTILDDDSTTIEIYYALDSETGIKGLSYAVTDFGDLTITHLSENSFELSGDFVDMLLLGMKHDDTLLADDLFTFYVDGTEKDGDIVVHEYDNGDKVYVTITDGGTSGSIIFAIMGPASIYDVIFEDDGTEHVVPVIGKADPEKAGIWRAATCFVE